MPEGPEIHRAASKIRNALEGKTIEDVEITLPRYEERANEFLDKTVLKVEARGKAMLIHFRHLCPVQSQPVVRAMDGQPESD